MDKLIELLREFPSNDAKVLDKEDSAIIDTWQEFVYWNRIYLYETIISKKFGFIKRLVDNDKIDPSKIEIHWFSFYESVLMELSIQDNPIEFLISILK